jgi:hypothetical protein
MQIPQQPRRTSPRLLRVVPRSRRQPPNHLDRAALVDRHAHQLVPRIAHLPPAVLLALDDLVRGLRGGRGRGVLLLPGHPGEFHLRDCYARAQCRWLGTSIPLVRSATDVELRKPFGGDLKT